MRLLSTVSLGCLAAAATAGWMSTSFAASDNVSVSSSGRNLERLKSTVIAPVKPSDPGPGAKAASDAAESSGEGGPTGRTIFGSDDRFRVKPTTKYPARAVVLIESDGGQCSGFIINKNTVVTAGHCVHEGGSNNDFFPEASFTITPGANGNKAPYGTCGARELYTVTGWANKANESFDYGAIKLDCNVGKKTGSFGYFFTNDSLLGLDTDLNGYPEDKANDTQWRSDDFVRAEGQFQVFYKNDTAGGQAGSAVYTDLFSDCDPCALGIHGYGVHGGSSNAHLDFNHGVKITRDVADNLRAWERDNP